MGRFVVPMSPTETLVSVWRIDHTMSILIPMILGLANFFNHRRNKHKCSHLFEVLHLDIVIIVVVLTHSPPPLYALNILTIVILQFTTVII